MLALTEYRPSDSGEGEGDGDCANDVIEIIAAAKPADRNRRVPLNFDVLFLVIFVTVPAPYLKKLRCALDPWIAAWQIVQF